ncbi:hypothetical protein [Aliamphritea hakodatensis]|uniref:hypothetical protein n=1 Tax=Aliamphritea hakodatensis TaxID=2895352 RepID=UPI0022FD8316|nr:hypothetical protein [Aliamphritea hakodatensis]
MSIKERVSETTNSVGPGDIVLRGGGVKNARLFKEAYAVGDWAYYVIEVDGGAYEAGEAQVTAVGLARASGRIIYSTNDNNPLDLPEGTHHVYCDTTEEEKGRIYSPFFVRKALSVAVEKGKFYLLDGVVDVGPPGAISSPGWQQMTSSYGQNPSVCVLGDVVLISHTKDNDSYIDVYDITGATPVFLKSTRVYSYVTVPRLARIDGRKAVMAHRDSSYDGRVFLITHTGSGNLSFSNEYEYYSGTLYGTGTYDVVSLGDGRSVVGYCDNGYMQYWLLNSDSSAPTSIRSGQASNRSSVRYVRVDRLAGRRALFASFSAVGYVQLDVIDFEGDAENKLSHFEISASQEALDVVCLSPSRAVVVYVNTSGVQAQALSINNAGVVSLLGDPVSISSVQSAGRISVAALDASSLMASIFESNSAGGYFYKQLRFTDAGVVLDQSLAMDSSNGIGEAALGSYSGRLFSAAGRYNGAGCYFAEVEYFLPDVKAGRWSMIAAEAAAENVPAWFVLRGGPIEGVLTGLTAGKEYGLDSAGELGDLATHPYPVGMALSSDFMMTKVS